MSPTVRQSNLSKRVRKPSHRKPKTSGGENGVDALLHEKTINTYLKKNDNIASEARKAAKWLLDKRSEKPWEEIVKTLRRVMESLNRGTLTVFFSYKAKDQDVAKKISTRLKQWSAGKLEILGMERFSTEEAGRDYRKEIMETIPKCDWFLLLLPTPGEQGDERDWVLLEAGYYLRGLPGQDLAGRLVCLHHRENTVAKALDNFLSVAAEPEAVKDFFTGLFREENWIPGWGPLNENLKDEDIDAMAKEIVDLIQPPIRRTCCGPHMEVRFEDAKAVKGWEQLAVGTVIQSNDDCKNLFGLEVRKTLFGDWFKKAEGYGRNDGWVDELASAIRAVGEGYSDIPQMRWAIKLGDHCYVRPKICAVKRRKVDKDDRVESIDFLFNESDAPETSTMNPDLAALALTLQFAIPFRYQVLEQYAGRELKSEDIQRFNGQMNALLRQTASDPRFADSKTLRKKVIGLFTGADKAVVETMYKRADEMWCDGKGAIDKAVANFDATTLKGYIEELLKMNQDFLTLTSQRFAELIAQPSRH